MAWNVPSEDPPLVLTHGHTDHYGLAARIVRLSGAEVFAHTGDAHFIEEHPEAFLRWVAFLRRFLPEAGLSPEQAAQVCERIEQKSPSYAEAVTLARVLEGGETLKLGGLRVQVLHTPGHSPGSICLYAPSHGLLFAGDVLLEKITPNPILQAFDDFLGERFEGLAHYLDSLRKLEALSIQQALPGHRREILDVRGRVQEIRLKIEERKGRLLQLLRGKELTILEATERLFPDLDERQLLLALFDTIGHLDLLRREGVVEYSRRAGLVVGRSLIS